MKKTPPLSKKKRFQKRLRVLGLILVILVGIGFITSRTDIRSAIYDSVKNTSLSIFRGVSTVVRTPFDWIGNSVQAIIAREDTFAENKRLRNQVNALLTEQAQTQQTHLNNKILQEKLSLIPVPPASYFTGRIYADLSSSFTKSVLVNIGAQQGIERYAPVLANGALFGQVVEVYPSFSRVVLLTDSTIKVPVMSASSHERFFLQGDNESSGILIFPEGKTHLEKGEKIMTSGFQGIFPENIPVGTIVKNRKNSVVHFTLQTKEVEYVQILKTTQKDSWKKEEKK